MFPLALLRRLGLDLTPHNSIYDSLRARFSFCLLKSYLELADQGLGTSPGDANSLTAVTPFVYIHRSLYRTDTWARGSGKERLSVITLL